MTIIEPKKRKSNKKILIIMTLAIIFGGSFLAISFYNQTVDLRYRILNKEKELSKLQVSNAELKDKIYSILDVNNISKIARERGLVLEKNPSYIESATQKLVTNL